MKRLFTIRFQSSTGNMQMERAKSRRSNILMKTDSVLINRPNSFAKHSTHIYASACHSGSIKWRNNASTTWPETLSAPWLASYTRSSTCQRTSNFSNVWLESFKKRCRLRYLTYHGEAASINTDNVEEERTRVRAIIDRAFVQGYTHRHV